MATDKQIKAWQEEFERRPNFVCWDEIDEDFGLQLEAFATFMGQKSADNARCILCKKEKPVICGYCKQAEMEAAAEAERKELEPHMKSSHRRCQEHPTNRLYYCDQCIKTSIASERQRVATEFYQFIKNKQKKLKKDELEDMWWYCHEEILDWIKKKWKV